MINQILYKDIYLNIPKRYNIPNLLNRFKDNSYEKNEYYLLNKYINKNDNILELGSCLGFLSIVSSKKVNKIISVEANPELYKALLKTKKDNNCNNL